MSTISSPIYHGITLDTPGYVSPLTITADGTVSNSTAGYAIYGATGTVVNYGLISESGSAVGDAGIYLSGAGSVINSGTISSVGGYGVQIFGVGGISNSGTITGGRQGVHARDAFSITNTGTISGGSDAIGLFAGGYVTNSGGITGLNGLGIAGGAGTVVNSGSITAIYGTGISLAAGGSITNSATGVISSGGLYYTGVFIGGGAARIINYGTITGNTGLAIYAAGTASQTIVNGGTIIGSGGTAIAFAAGNDLLVLQTGYGFSGGIAGGAGTDTLELDGSGGALTVNYNSLGLTGFEKVLFGAGNNAKLQVSNNSGTVGATISGFDATTETIDLTGIGSNGQVTNHDTVNNRVTITGSLGSVTMQLDASDGTVFRTTADSTGGTNFTIACFSRGTLIRTPSGEVPVEALATGDRVETLSGWPRPIKWIGRRAYDPRFVRGNRNILPVRIMAGALAAGLPERDLCVSPEHALYLRGLFLPARQLINGVTIRQPDWDGDIEYFHIELDSHDVIFAEGAAAETFVAFGGRGMFHNGVEFAALYPDDKPPAWEPYEALLEQATAGLPSVRAGLLARAERLGLVSRDSDLHLLVDGEIVRAQAVGKDVHHFAVAANATEVRIASRSAVPAETEVNSLDRRRVGVPVQRIALRAGDRWIVIGPECALLRDGFHADEGSHRWTDGHATLPPQLLGCFSGEIEIEVQIGATDLHYATDARSGDIRQHGRAIDSGARSIAALQTRIQ